MDSSKIESRDTSIVNGLQIRLHSQNTDNSGFMSGDTAGDEGKKKGDFLLWTFDKLDEITLNQPTELRLGTNVILPMRQSRTVSDGVDCQTETNLGEPYSKSKCVLDAFRSRSRSDCGCDPFFTADDFPPLNAEDMGNKCSVSKEIFCVADLRQRLKELGVTCPNLCSTTKYASVPQYSLDFSSGLMNKTWEAQRLSQVGDKRYKFSTLTDEYMDELWSIYRMIFYGIPELKAAYVDPIDTFLQAFQKSNLNLIDNGRQRRPFEALYVGNRSQHQLLQKFEDSKIRLTTVGEYLDEENMNFSRKIHNILPNDETVAYLQTDLRPDSCILHGITRGQAQNLQKTIEDVFQTASNESLMPIDRDIRGALLNFMENCSVPCPPSSSSDASKNESSFNVPLMCSTCDPNCETSLSYLTMKSGLHILCFNGYVFDYPTFYGYVQQIESEMKRVMSILLARWTTWNLPTPSEEEERNETLAKEYWTSGGRLAVEELQLFKSFDKLVILREGISRIRVLKRDISFVIS